MRDLRELVNDAEDAIDLVQEWARSSPRPVEILPVDREAGKKTLLALQITTRSVLGAIAFHTGGVLIDHRWLRHLGSGSAALEALIDWNQTLGGDLLDPPLEGGLIVAYDILGGFFAINAGGLDGPDGSMHYWAPDAQTWEPLDLGHGDFVAWSMGDRFEIFYDDLRWSGWEAEVAGLGRGEGLALYPPLGFKDLDREKTAMSERHRSRASMPELWLEYHEIARQSGGLPDGAEVRFDWTE